MSGLWRQGEELRCRQGDGHERREEESCRSAIRRSRWWPTPGGRPRPRSTRCQSSGMRGRMPRCRAPAIAEMLKEGLDAEQAFVGNQSGDAQGAIAGAAKKIEAVYAYPFQNHALHGADERDGALYARTVRSVGADAERRSRVRGDAGGLGPPGRQVRGLQDPPRRRFRAARCVPRLRHASRAHRQADAWHAGQDALVARRGHAARALSPGHAMQARRRPGRQQQPDRPAHAHLRAVDSCRGAAGSPAERARPGHVPGSQPQRGVHAGLHGPEPVDRPRDAQYARAAPASGAG